MLGIYIQKTSPYYWFRFYDKSKEPGERRRSINTKIEVTPGDRKRWEEAKRTGTKVKLQCNEEVKELVRGFRKGLNERDIEKKTGVKIIKSPILSKCIDEYIFSKSRKGDKKALKEKSRSAYRNAGKRFIEATGRDVVVTKYTKADYDSLLAYMEDNEYAEPSRRSFTTHLSSLWNYFVKKKYCKENIIEIYEGSKTKKPEDIPLEDFKNILKFYEHNPQRWEIIYYLLLSMNRPSTALMQERSRIDSDSKIIEMLNVKETRKKSKYYIYPLFAELEQLIRKILTRKVVDDSDRLFSHFPNGKSNYTDSLWWWYTDQKKLVKSGILKKTYELKQIRKTFPSYALNELGLSKEEVKWLLDHTDEEISENHYLNIRYDSIRERFDKQRMIGSGSITLPENTVQDNSEKINQLISDKRKTFNITKSELWKLIRNQIPNTQIAKMFNVSETAVRKKIKKIT